jgi:hypothetical protein
MSVSQVRLLLHGCTSLGRQHGSTGNYVVTPYLDTIFFDFHRDNYATSMSTTQMEILNPIPVLSSKDVVLRVCKENPIQIISLMLDHRLFFAFNPSVAVIANRFIDQ